MERKNISIGHEVSRLLPIELANYVMDHSKKDFLRRFSESQTLVFDTKGKDRKGKGPIIICMDESSSMTSIKEHSKAFCIALLTIAKKQKRDFAIIPFASTVGDVQVFRKGQATTQDLLTFSNSFLGGGTNYEQPLRESLNILLQSEFNEADILFVTDGSSFLSTHFIDEFNATKKKKQFECTAVILTNLFNTVDVNLVNKFSDRVIEVNELFDAGDVFVL
ncbi:vWA domain-containing protein [Solibacillus daqui]|uniref:vWA domain-containing protein n=1 Tax=Solibacillus daqui TaxID=2912187 RepID=UPI0023670ABA|nr:VWA domain-containing protein [Solibacillus daqui]